MLRILGLSTVTFNDIVERIGITMLNAFLFYSITNILNFHNFLFFGMGIVIILSALLPYVLAPALTLIYILGYNFSSLFLSSTNTITLPMLERAVLMIIFFFIVPILVQIKYTSLQGFLTTESMLGSIISPVFIGTGVSEKGRDPKSNVISALPALYIIVFKVLNSLPAFSISSILYPSIGLVLLILSSILFTRRSLISLVGVIPLYPGISLVLGLDYLSPYVIVASLLGLAVNAIPSVINFTRTLSQNKSTIEKEKREMISQIEDKVRLINNIKGGSVNLPVEFVEVLSEAESSLKSQLAKVNSCIDNDCVTESFKEFQSVQESVDKMINDAVFKIVIDYNNVVNNIRKLGVNAEEIPIPPVLKLNELDVNTIVRILNTIDRNIYYTTNKVNQILEGVEKTVGGKYSRILVTDYKSLDKISAILGDQVIRKGTEECLAIQADVVRELRLSPLNDQRIVLSKKINQVMIENFSLDKINNIVSITDEHIALLKKYLELLSNKRDEIRKLELPEMKDYVKVIEDLTFVINSNLQLCEKIRRVYSFISVLNDVDTIISDIESISALFQLLESLGDMITIKISEEGCVNLDEVGIEQKYGRYVVSWLKVRGVETLLKGNQICRAN